MGYLRDFEVRRSGAFVSVQWHGVPRFSIGVFALSNDVEAFEQAARAIEKGQRQGIDPYELTDCASALRQHALSVRKGPRYI